MRSVRMRSGTIRIAVGLVALFAALSAAGCGAKQTSNSGANGQTLLGAGTAAYKQGDYNAATQLFAQALAKMPGDLRATFDLATAQQALGDDTDAASNYRKVLQSQPSDAAALYNLGTLEMTSQPQEAEGLFQRAIAVQPNSPTAHFDLAVTELKLGNTSAATTDLETALGQDPTLRSKLDASLANLLNGASSPATTIPAQTTTSTKP